jgi:hypothetical protein
MSSGGSELVSNLVISAANYNQMQNSMESSTFLGKDVIVLSGQSSLLEEAATRYEEISQNTFKAVQVMHNALGESSLWESSQSTQDLEQLAHTLSELETTSGSDAISIFESKSNKEIQQNFQNQVKVTQQLLKLRSMDNFLSNNSSFDQEDINEMLTNVAKFFQVVNTPSLKDFFSDSDIDFAGTIASKLQDINESAHPTMHKSPSDVSLEQISTDQKRSSSSSNESYAALQESKKPGLLARNRLSRSRKAQVRILQIVTRLQQLEPINKDLFEKVYPLNIELEKKTTTPERKKKLEKLIAPLGRQLQPIKREIRSLEVQLKKEQAEIARLDTLIFDSISDDIRPLPGTSLPDSAQLQKGLFKKDWVNYLLNEDPNAKMKTEDYEVIIQLKDGSHQRASIPLTDALLVDSDRQNVMINGESVLVSGRFTSAKPAIKHLISELVKAGASIDDLKGTLKFIAQTINADHAVILAPDPESGLLLKPTNPKYNIIIEGNRVVGLEASTDYDIISDIDLSVKSSHIGTTRIFFRETSTGMDYTNGDATISIYNK